MNYFSRSRRKYPEQEDKRQQRRQHSQDDEKKIVRSPGMNFGDVNATSEITEIFSFKIQDVIDASDPALCWSYNVPIRKPNEKAIYLATEAFQTILPNYVGDDFPQTICFAIRDFNGYCSKDGTPTKNVIVMDLVATAIKTTANGITMRDLSYRNQNNVVWNLGNLRSLRMQVTTGEDQTPIPMPLSTPIQISFRIIHVVI